MRRTALAPAPRPQKRTMARFCPPLPRPLAWATAARGAAARALSSLSPSRGLIPLKNISDFKDPRVEKSQGQKFRRTDIVATGKFIGWENQVSRPRIHKSRDCSASPVPQTTCADCVGSSGDLLPPSPPADCTHALVKPSAAHTNMISAQNMRTPRKPEMTTVFIWSVSKLPWPTVNKHFLDAGVSEMSFFGQTRCGWPRRCALRVNEDTASLVQALFSRRRHQPSRPARTVVCSMRDFEPRLSKRVQKIKLCATWVVVPNF